MVEPLATDTRAHLRADDDGEDRFDFPARVLIEGDYQQTVVAWRPPRIPVEVLFHPTVAGADRAIVHAVTHIRAHKRHGRQLGVVPREGCERPIDACRQRAEVDPWVVLAHVATRCTSAEPGLRQRLGIPNEAEARLAELMAQVVGPFENAAGMRYS
jgi:hypothetical protein